MAVLTPTRCRFRPLYTTAQEDLHEMRFDHGTARWVPSTQQGPPYDVAPIYSDASGKA